jgi:serine phosphatase RsbU (regulator of sigma subunit)/CheY-like chemotaxis protein
LKSLRIELKNALQPHYQVEIAESGEEAIEIVQEYLADGYHIPVVICDYIMPYMKGDEVLIQVHTLTHRTRKIMLTGQSSIEGITNVINQADLYRFIAKPWSPADMAMTIQQAVRSYEQDLEIDLKNRQLSELNAQLEQKVIVRTAQLHRANSELSTAIDELNNQKEIIENKNRDITASLNYAKRIQTAILPSDERLNNYFAEHFILYRPRDIVSGDFYWCEKVDEHPIYEEDKMLGTRVFKGFQNEKIVIAAVDCTGHGVPGAFMSMIGNDILNGIIIQDGIVIPNIILAKLHKGIRKLLRQSETLINDGMDISLCVIDMVEKTLTFAGAKSPFVYIQHNQLKYIKGDKIPIGGHKLAYDYAYEQHTIDISVPTFCYIFSDGYQDQFGGQHNKKYMVRRLREFFYELHRLPCPLQKEMLEQELDKWIGEQRQTDDILVIGFQCFAP